MEVMKKTITINNRELLRNYRHYREQLLNGDITRVIIPVNGKSIYFAAMPSKTRPGDIRPLLERIKNENPYKDLKFIRPRSSTKNLTLMKKLWGKKNT